MVYVQKRINCFQSYYLGETHESIEGPFFDHQLLDVIEAFVQIPVLREALLDEEKI
jgi:hypothetical protein